MKQRYDSYKPSGIDWIGDIPSHWNNCTLKQASSSIRNGYVGPTKDILVDDGIPYFQSLHVKDGKLLFDRGEYYVTKKWADKHPKIYKDDIVIVQTGDIGQVAIVPAEYDGCNCHALIIVVSDKQKINPLFLLYYLRSSIGKELMLLTKTGATLPHLNSGSICNTQLILPPLSEQEAIAAWLDEKCEEIDAAIAKVDREIELIDELKQSEISRIVTRGLDPDAPLRSSGIDWIGDIPEHWTKCRLKFIGSARNGLTYSPSDVKDSGKLVIRSSNIQDAKLNYDDCVFVANYPETLSVNSGDTIICSRNGSINLIGKSVFIENDMDVTFGAFMMRFRPYEHPKYSHYLLSIAISRYKGLFATTTINQLTADSLGKMEAVMPPYMEQVQIADYLDKKCAEIDGLKAKLTKKRETLTELRQSIISEVVTGKCKVI